MNVVPYNRMAAFRYAEAWALYRNPEYFDFSEIGGDCTNFVSQCLYAGSGVMNFSQHNGWYYNSLNDRAAAWTSVEALFRFLTTNRGPGPFGHETVKNEIYAGDVIQLGKSDGTFYHSLFVLDYSPPAVYVAAHSYDALWRELSTYDAAEIRYIHIDGVRK